MASKYPYRTEDTFVQHILIQALEHYQNTKLFDMTGLEASVVTRELGKLTKLSNQRLLNATVPLTLPE
jgi:hypothetical protein